MRKWFRRLMNKDEVDRLSKRVKFYKEKLNMSNDVVNELMTEIKQRDLTIQSKQFTIETLKRSNAELKKSERDLKRKNGILNARVAALSNE